MVRRVLNRIHIWSAGAVLVVTLSSALASAEPKDAAATALDKEAMQVDYLGMQFKKAEQKLKKALKVCGRNCSASVQAELHRDLAVVYIEGLKKKREGKQQMQAAIKADPSVQLRPDFTTSEVEKVFVAAGGIVQNEPEPEPEPEPEETKPAEPPPPEPEPDSGARKNWLSLSFQQDMLLFKETTGVCTGAAQYQCFLQGDVYEGPVYGGSGNQLKGGLGFATKRVLLGYERLITDNITLGVKLGFAFGGRPKADTGDTSSFFPIHAELRGNYWFGDAPLSSAGVRGYVGAAGGMAEVDERVVVEFFKDEAGYQQGRVGKLDAWRKTGKVMLGLQGGLGYAFAPEHAILLELRLVQMLGDSAFGGAVGAGYSLGL
jgi:hypothetical protein